MLEVLAYILVVLWMLGLVTSTAMDGSPHILLLIAIFLILIRLVRGWNIDRPPR